ncbi:Probable nucleoredoxin 1 [Seminavis robusta]|uniref:Probable nucleoredoxin 1 n=1 Tax=Seminavis robusta TaxID=568900 RepID=A0A9N8HL84_9STRA|nr:Probable nucleoredoxin 1 [Seminavis robusta]|eukprot:Sro791_g202940.1 Probable nucleoredoxin 1 (422) ;mRNA; f:13397-14826
MSDKETKFLAQFGDELWSSSSGEMVKTADALTGKKVMIYFSASWCPPCRRFTPMLIAMYNKLKEDPKRADTFELVFVSLDRSESDYNDYTSKMPWKSVPYSAPEPMRRSLAMKYGAEGIPHLVVIDETEDRNLITSDGTGEVSLDPDGDNFPWKPKGFSEIFPKQFMTKQGLVDSSTIDKKHLMLYFSAHWCPPCRKFTPVLAEAYKKLMEERGDEVELLFVSSDREESSFQEYWGTMPFCALPYEERDAKMLLSKLYGVRGIPSLLILGPVPEGGGDRPLINDNLRAVIESNDFSEFPFHPKPYQDLAVGADGINEHKSLVVFCENEDDDEQKELTDMVKTVAEKLKDTDMRFFYATSPGGLVGAIRKVIKIEKKLDGVIMALLDIPSGGGYHISDETDLTVEKIEEFLTNPGERQQMTQ